MNSPVVGQNAPTAATACGVTWGVRESHGKKSEQGREQRPATKAYFITLTFSSVSK